MKTLTVLTALALPAFAQTGGSLTPPPGAPAPAMKSLDRVEPRVPLVSGAPGVTIGVTGTITITQPGSYYLTGNLTVTSGNGVVINASDVSLDLMGFTIGTSASGISSAGIAGITRNTTIRNGNISSSIAWDGSVFSGTGFLYGIESIALLRNVAVRDVSIFGTAYGIYFPGGGNNTVDSCTVDTVNNTGIYATVASNCSVMRVGGAGIVATQVDNCHAYSVGASAISASLVSGSYGVSISTSGTRYGIAAATVTGSYGSSTRGSGIYASNLVSGSTGSTTMTSTSTHGIECGGTVSHSYGLANAIGSGHGIHVSGIYGNVTHSTGVSLGLDGINASSVSNSTGHAAISGARHGINATYVTHSRGSRATTEANKYGIIATRAVGCYPTQGESITQKYDMP